MVLDNWKVSVHKSRWACLAREFNFGLESIKKWLPVLCKEPIYYLLLESKKKRIYTEQDRPLPKSYLEFQEWREMDWAYRVFLSCALKQWSPTILAPAKVLCKKIFPRMGGRWGWFLDDSSVWHLLCTLLLLLLHQLQLRSAGIRYQRLGIPALKHPDWTEGAKIL